MRLLIYNRGDQPVVVRSGGMTSPIKPDSSMTIYGSKIEIIPAETEPVSSLTDEAKR